MSRIHQRHRFFESNGHERLPSRIELICETYCGSPEIRSIILCVREMLTSFSCKVALTGPPEDFGF